MAAEPRTNRAALADRFGQNDGRERTFAVLQGTKECQDRIGLRGAHGMACAAAACFRHWATVIRSFNRSNVCFGITFFATSSPLILYGRLEMTRSAISLVSPRYSTSSLAVAVLMLTGAPGD